MNAAQDRGNPLPTDWLDFLWVSLGVLGEEKELNTSGRNGSVSGDQIGAVSVPTPRFCRGPVSTRHDPMLCV